MVKVFEERRLEITPPIRWGRAKFIDGGAEDTKMRIEPDSLLAGHLSGIHGGPDRVEHSLGSAAIIE